MNLLTPKLKLGVLKGLSTKMRAYSPLKEADSLKEPKIQDPLTARLARKVNPDYKPIRKYNLSNKLF